MAAPKSLGRFEPVIDRMAQKYGVDPSLVRGVIWQESRGNPDAVSPAGARGLMQLMPETARDLGVNPDDPIQNIEGGTRYLAEQLKRFRGSEELALAAYNAGPGAVMKYGNRVPPYDETRQYVPKVLGFKAAYAVGGTRVPEGPPPSPEAFQRFLEAQSQSNDSRLPVLREGLRILGKTPEMYGAAWGNSQFREDLYRATMRHAESLDPKLAYSQGQDAYLGVLRKSNPFVEDTLPSPTTQPSGTAQRGAEAAPTGEQPVPLLPQGKAGIVDVGKQILRGVTADIAVGLTGAAEDAAKIYDKAVSFLPESLQGVLNNPPLPGLMVGKWLNDAAKGDGKRVSVSLREWANETFGAPESTVSAGARGLAGFLVPFGLLSKGTKATSTAANVTSAIVSGTLIDPDDPLLTEAIYNLAEGVSPENPAAFRGMVNKYIAGQISEDELVKRFAMRGLRAAEDTILGVAVDGVIKGLRHVFRSNEALKAINPPLPPSVPKPAVLEAMSPEQLRLAFKESPEQLPLPLSFKGETLTPVDLSKQLELPLTGTTGPTKITAADIPTTGTSRTAASGTKGTVDVTIASPVTADEFSAAVKAVNPQTGAVDGQLDLFRAPLVPEAERITGVEAMQLAEEMLDSPATKGEIGSIIELIRKLPTDPANQKAVLAAVIKGGVSGWATAELLEPEGAEAANETTEDAQARWLTAFLVGLGAGVGGGVAVSRIARSMRKTAQQTSVENIQPLLRTSPPPLPKVRDVTEALFPKTKPVLTPSDIVDVDALAEKVHAKIGNVFDPDDLDALYKAGDDVFDGAPNMARQQFLGTRLDDIDEYARAIGEDPKLLKGFMEELGTPLQDSVRARTVLYLAKQSQQEITELSARWVAGDKSPQLAQMLMDRIAFAGEVAKGLRIRSSDYGRALNMFRQAADGRIMHTLFEEGGRVVDDTDLDTLAARMLKLGEEDPGSISDAARQMTSPTRGKAFAEIFINSLLGAVRTPFNALKGGMGRLLLNPIIRGEGAAAARLLPSGWTGGVQADTPVIQEMFTMYHAFLTHLADGMKVAAKTVYNGQTQFVEYGASQGATRLPQFGRAAFRAEAKALDTVGSLVGLPKAGNVFDYVGGFFRLIGNRGLLAADEFTQYMAQHMELAAWATRRAQQEGLGGEARDAFIAQFMKNPPEDVMQHVRREKVAASFMQSLKDDTGGFQGLRKMAAGIEQALGVSPLARVQFPFIRAVTNLLNFTLELSPGVNLLSKSFRQELMSTDPIVRSTAQGKMLTGLTLGGLFTAMGGMGVVRGRLSRDPAYMEELRRAGIPENSISLWGQTWKLDPTEPLGFFLTAFGQLGAAANGVSVAEDEIDAFASLYLAMYGLLKNQAAVTAFTQLWQDIDPKQILTGRERRGTLNVVGETLDEFLLKPLMPPRAFQELRQFIDPYRRVYESYWERIQSRTPGMSDDLPKETDIFGRPRVIGGGLHEGTIDNSVRILFGINAGSAPVDPLSKALTDKQITISDPQLVMEVGGVSVPLTRVEGQQLRSMMAHPKGFRLSLYDAVLKVTESPRWKGYTAGSEGQADVAVKQVISQYSEAARKQFLNESEVVKERVIAKAKLKGLMR